MVKVAPGKRDNLGQENFTHVAKEESEAVNIFLRLCVSACHISTGLF